MNAMNHFSGWEMEPAVRYRKSKTSSSLILQQLWKHVGKDREDNLKTIWVDVPMEGQTSLEFFASFDEAVARELK